MILPTQTMHHYSGLYSPNIGNLITPSPPIPPKKILEKTGFATDKGLLFTHHWNKLVPTLHYQLSRFPQGWLAATPPWETGVLSFDGGITLLLHLLKQCVWKPPYKSHKNHLKTHRIHGTEIGIFTYNEWLIFYGFSCRYIYNRPMDGMGKSQSIFGEILPIVEPWKGPIQHGFKRNLFDFLALFLFTHVFLKSNCM